MLFVFVPIEVEVLCPQAPVVASVQCQRVNGQLQAIEWQIVIGVISNGDGCDATMGAKRNFLNAKSAECPTGVAKLAIMVRRAEPRIRRSKDRRIHQRAARRFGGH